MRLARTGGEKDPPENPCRSGRFDDLRASPPAYEFSRGWSSNLCGDAIQPARLPSVLFLFNLRCPAVAPDRTALLEQPDRLVERRRRQVHVAHRRREVRMTGQQHIKLAMIDFCRFLGFINGALNAQQIQRLETMLMGYGA